MCSRPSGFTPTSTPVPVLEKTKVGRLWAYVRDDRPFAGPAPPAAVFFYSPDRGGEHSKRHLASFAEIMQADAYAVCGLQPALRTRSAAGPHPRSSVLGTRQTQALRAGRSAKAPIAAEAVRRIDELFAREGRQGRAGRQAARADRART